MAGYIASKFNNENLVILIKTHSFLGLLKTD